MLVSGIAQSGQNLALNRLANIAKAKIKNTYDHYLQDLLGINQT